MVVVEPLLPTKVRGVPRVDDRRVLNGIFWRLRTGAPWADIPSRYGPYTTCVNRFNRWRKAGHWARILQAVSKAYEGDIQMIDSSSIRVHQHAANAKKRRPIPLHGSFAQRPDDQDTRPGRALCLPIGLKLTEGHAHDGRSAADMLDGLGEGCILPGDRACDSNALRATLAERGAWACVKPMPGRVHIPAFSPFLYRYRNLVERFFSKLKHFAPSPPARTNAATIPRLSPTRLYRIWLRHNESVT